MGATRELCLTALVQIDNRIASFYTKYNRWCRMFGKDKHFPFNCGFSPGAACCGKVIAVLPDHTEMSDMQLL